MVLIQYTDFDIYPQETSSLVAPEWIQDSSQNKVSSTLIKQAARNEVPLFGVCLCNQLLAHALVADVRSVPTKGIGRKEVTLGDAAYGLLFHLEVTSEMVADMMQAFANELRKEGLDGPTIRQAATHHTSKTQHVAKAVFGQWADQVHG